MKQYLAIDIGGTAVKLGIVDEEGRVLSKTEQSVCFDNYETPILTTVLSAAEQFLKEQAVEPQGLAGIGVSAAGQIDTRKGIVAGTCGSLPNYIGSPIKAELEAKFGLPTTVANDANCMTLGEVWVGAAQGYTDVIGVTLGTGVGGGIIANGQLVRGVHFTAGEYSFVNTNAEAWDAPDQNMACQCSTSNLLKWYRARKALPEDAPLDGRSFFAAANAGEPEALEVLRRFCHAVAVQIYNLTVLLDVEKVAIGGGISKQPLLLESLRSAYDGLYASRAGQAYMEGLPRCQIVPCAFSSEANQVGVAAAYFEAMQKKC